MLDNRLQEPGLRGLSPSQPSIERGRRVGVVAWVALALMLALSGRAWAGTVPMAGEGNDLWMMVTGGKTLGLYHRSVTDPRGQATPVSDLTGTLVTGGMAAWGGRVWLVFEDRTVRSVSVRSSVRPGERPFADGGNHAGLPECSLVSLAATPQGLWALVRVESDRALARIDAATQPATRGADRDARHGTPRATTRPTPSSAAPPSTARGRSGRDADSGADTEASGPVITSQPAPVNALRLLRLEKNQWLTTPLPEGLPADAKAWLLHLRPADGAPAVLAWRGEEGVGGELWLHRRSGVEWKARALRPSSAPPFVPVAVEGQVLLARVGPSESGPRVSLGVVGAEGEIELGAAMWLADASQAWGVAPLGQTAVVVRAEPDRKLTMAAMTLAGDSAAATPLAPPPRELLRESSGRIAQLALLGVGVMVMLVVMRKEQQSPRPKLPQGMVSADLFRRALAAGADLVPGVLAAMVVYRTSPDEVFANWPSASVYLLAFPPTLLALAVMVIHCTICESLTGRSLGKFLLGLRLYSVTGQPPRPWQILVRNLLKPVEIISWVMLFMPMILPLAQRFGDVLSRTLVLAPEPEDDDEGDQ